MQKFNTSCAVLAYISYNLLNEVGLSLFRYFEVGLRVCDIVVKKFTFAISSPDEFLLHSAVRLIMWKRNFELITPTLRDDLQWLPVRERIVIMYIASS